MNLKRTLRTFILLLFIGLFIFGLTSCKLPASTGPESTGEPSEEFPVPGETEPTTSGIDVNTFATQTAQAMPLVVITPVVPTQEPPETSPYPIATEVPPEPTIPPTPITIVVTPTPGGPPATYILQEGEYPFCIARRFNVNQGELLALNNLAVDELLSPGTELKIPQTGTPFEGTRALHDHPTTYIVDPGETLNSIACYFGDVSPELIALQNNLSSNEVSAGTELVIP